MFLLSVQAMQEIAASFGKNFTWELKSQMMGQKALTSAEMFVSHLELHGKITPEEVLIRREKTLDELFPTADMLPGAKRLLEHLKKNGIPFGLATSSHKRHFDLKTTRHRDTFLLFDHVTTGEAVQHGKPHPEIFLHARALWEPAPDPANCLVLEDAPSGVKSAKAAGMKCVMVPHPKLDRALCGEADEVIDSLEAFLPEKYGLPRF